MPLYCPEPIGNDSNEEKDYDKADEQQVTLHGWVVYIK
jgi:hypothetical protein